MPYVPVMDAEFWIGRWREGRTAFHEGKPNAFLVAHADRLAGCHRILVPLCGKSEDLAHLAGRGHDVIGVELVEDAVRQFFAEHAIEPAITRRDGFVVYTAGAITVFAGDMFATTAELLGPIDAVFDRAALIALPDDVRPRYADQIRAIAPAARTTLLVSIEYPTGSYEGPPFTVTESEVRTLFPNARVEFLEEAPDPRGRVDGKMIERCYLIVR